MYKLLIVDDERHIVNWLYELFEDFFMVNGLEVDISKSYSGREAVNMAMNIKFDIIISDICMPGMDGFALIDQVKTRWNRVKVIFLSAHDEFEYVYKSIKYREANYLLKTEDDEVIVQMVMDLLDETKREDEEVNAMNYHKNMLILLQQRELLRQIFMESLPIAQLTKDKLLEYCIDFSMEVPVFVLFARLVILPDSSIYKDWFGCLNDMNMIVKNHLSPRMYVAQYDYKESYLIWLLQPSFEQTDQTETVDWDYYTKYITETLDIVQTVLNSKLQIRSSFFFNSKVLQWDEVLQNVVHIESHIDYYFGQESGAVMTQDSLYGTVSEQIGLEKERMKLQKIKTVQLDRLSACLRQGNQAEFDVIFDDISSLLVGCRSIHDMVAIELYFSLSMLLLSFINNAHLAQKISFKVGLIHLSNLNMSSWKESVDYLKKVSNSIFELQDCETQIRRDHIVLEIMTYIENHIDGDLSLTRIADHVNYNPSYLSRYFKQATATNLYHYINERRLTKAAALLETSHDTVQAVAKKTGFDSSQYFSTSFKKFYGVTPQEYRDVNRIAQ